MSTATHPLRTAAATETVMQAVRRILIDRKRWAEFCTVDTLRPELEAAGISGNRCGAAVTQAYRQGWLIPTEDRWESHAPNARGRRVAVWRIAVRA